MKVAIVVEVELDDNGEAIGVRVAESGGPWAYSDQPAVFDAGIDDWRDATEAEAGAAEGYIARMVRLSERVRE